MINKNIFFKNISFKSKRYLTNLNRTKFFFKSLKEDIHHLETPLLKSFEKDYILDFDREVVKKFSKYKNIIILGMGGSVLGSQAIYSFFKKKIKKKVFFFDNLDFNIISNFEKIKNIKSSCFVVVSKSGNTLETITNFSFILSKVKIKNNLVFITEMRDNALMQLANKFNGEIIEHKKFIGGRFSVLSEVGMFPAALMGLNINKFKNFRQLVNNKNFSTALIQNVASIYTLNNQKINNSIIFSYDSRLNDLSYWYQQLAAESLSKNKKGIMPTISFGPRDHHSVLQLYLDGPKNKFFTFLSYKNNKSIKKINSSAIPESFYFLRNKKLESVISAQRSAVLKVFNLKKIPFRNFIFNQNNEKELGNIFTFFVLETILLAKLLNIDAFDQPAVEQVKIETKNILLK